VSVYRFRILRQSTFVERLSPATRQRGEVVGKDPALLELYVQLAESNLLSGSPSV
jgi:hypothetical protein